jgi:hypothetical protein
VDEQRVVDIFLDNIRALARAFAGADEAHDFLDVLYHVDALSTVGVLAGLDDPRVFRGLVLLLDGFQFLVFFI